MRNYSDWSRRISSLPLRRRADIPVRSNFRWVGWLERWPRLVRVGLGAK